MNFKEKNKSLTLTYAVKMLNGMIATRFPSCFWPYAKLCMLKAYRKGTTWTLLGG